MKKTKRPQNDSDHEDASDSKAKKTKTESIYGPRYQEDWPTEAFKPKWIEDNVPIGEKPKEMRLEDLMKRSAEFPIPFPINTARCQFLKTKVPTEELCRNINSTYPIVHERVLQLYSDFLRYKREFGSRVEKELYKDMDVVKLIDRFLKKRAVNFWGLGDKWQLMSKRSGIAGWDKIGTDEETDPLLLENCISYDEIKLSALLYVSGYTHFVNDGNRRNCGVTEKDRDAVEKEGVIMGLIGARLKRRNLMEYQDIIITKEQNNEMNGFTSETPKNSIIAGKQKWRNLWSNFYEEGTNTYDEVKATVKNCSVTKQTCRYFPARAKNACFDNMYYKKRMSLAFDTLMYEANYRAKAASKEAYINVVGIGLGVWRNAEHQEPAFLELFVQRLEALRDSTHDIADVHFAYFHTRPTDQVKDGMTIEDPSHPRGGVKIHIAKREPSSRLRGEHRGKLLIVTYAWDGNAQPGNEYWCKMLKSSGDSATACSTQVSELHNAHINTENVRAANVRVASRKYGLLRYEEYVRKCK